jgi:hypothetical protein
MLLLIILLCLVGLFVALRKRKANFDVTAVTAVHLSVLDGNVVVPVRAIESRGGFGGFARNSIRPTFSIAGDRFRIRIFKERELPFSQVSEIDVAKGIFGSALIGIKGKESFYRVRVAGLGIAKAVLVALPATIPLSGRAAQLRS